MTLSYIIVVTVLFDHDLTDCSIIEPCVLLVFLQGGLKGTLVPTKRYGRPRPLLVTLNRSSDVNSILSKRSQLKSPFFIKPDLSRDARVTESHLLKVRWSLIQDNTPKSDIKIRGNKIYVKGKLHGQADSAGFRPNEPSSTDSTSPPHNNIETSTAASTSSA